MNIFDYSTCNFLPRMTLPKPITKSFIDVEENSMMPDPGRLFQAKYPPDKNVSDNDKMPDIPDLGAVENGYT